MLKKILFVETATPGVHIFSLFKMPRLGSLILATILSKKGYETKVILEEHKPLTREDINDFDVIAVSCLTSSAPRSYEIIKYAHELGKIVIAGGPHVTFEPEEALLSGADYVLKGEAEESLPALLEALNAKSSLDAISGLSYMKDDTFVHNKTEDFTLSLDDIPDPDFSLLDNDWQKGWMMKIIPVMTSRGCPFDCTFCTVTQMFGKKYRFMSPDRIIELIKKYNDSKHLLFFYDDNFTANKKHSKELLNKMIAMNVQFKWIAQVRTDIAEDAELLALMKKAGCIKVFIGFETVNPNALKNIKKGQTIQKMIDSIKKIHKAGISVHGMFILGIPGDTIATMKNTVRFALKYKLESAQFLILTPFPGTLEYKKYRGDNAIILDDFSLYDTHHAVIRPTELSASELQIMQIWAHKKFYSGFNTVIRLLTGKFVDAFVSIYASMILKSWILTNKKYLNAIKDTSASKIDFSLDHSFEDVHPDLKLPLLMRLFVKK